MGMLDDPTVLQYSITSTMEDRVPNHEAHVGLPFKGW